MTPANYHRIDPLLAEEIESGPTVCDAWWRTLSEYDTALIYLYIEPEPCPASVGIRAVESCIGPMNAAQRLDKDWQRRRLNDGECLSMDTLIKMLGEYFTTAAEELGYSKACVYHEPGKGLYDWVFDYEPEWVEGYYD